MLYYTSHYEIGRLLDKWLVYVVFKKVKVLFHSVSSKLIYCYFPTSENFF